MVGICYIRYAICLYLIPYLIPYALYIFLLRAPAIGVQLRVGNGGRSLSGSSFALEPCFTKKLMP